MALCRSRSWLEEGERGESLRWRGKGANRDRSEVDTRFGIFFDGLWIDRVTFCLSSFDSCLY
jgi:hypothetical protein